MFALGCKRNGIMEFCAAAGRQYALALMQYAVGSRRRHSGYVLLPVCQHLNSAPFR